MRSANLKDISQRRMDHISWVQEVKGGCSGQHGTRSRLVESGLKGENSRERDWPRYRLPVPGCSDLKFILMVSADCEFYIRFTHRRFQ
jgi:hypothetical protein